MLHSEFKVLMSVALFIILMAISLNLNACSTYKYCLSKSISYTEVINYNGNNMVINITIVRELISEKEANITVRLDLLSYTKGLKINYTPPLLDYVIGYSDGRVKRWSEGKFFIQVILSEELPISKSYSMITDYGCIQYIIIKIRPLNYVRTISVAEISYLPGLSQEAKAIVTPTTPKTYTVTSSLTPKTTKAVKTKLEEIVASIETTTSKEERSTITPETTIREYEHFTKSPETSIAIQAREDLLRIDIRALSIAITIASLLAVLVYIYILRVSI